MALDPEVEKAVKEAVIALEIEQSEQLANRLLAWLRDLSERDLSAEEANQHLINVRKVATRNDREHSQ